MNKKKIKIKPINIFVHTLFLVGGVVCVYPFLLILFNAITGEGYIVEHGYVLWPKEITLSAFEFVLRAPQQLLFSSFISIIDSVGGTIFSLIVCTLAGYALTREEFILKRPLEIFLFIGMILPSVGLIPEYMVNTKIYHLENNILAYILPGAVTSMTIFLMRTCFNQVPKEIIESATIDGATPMKIWSSMMIPLSKSFIGTQFFLGMSGKWKTFTTSLYYMSEPKLQNMEYYIQQVVKDVNVLVQSAEQMGIDSSSYPKQTMQFAIVFFALIPVMIIFPLMQKFFEKGAIVGSVKG